MCRFKVTIGKIMLPDQLDAAPEVSADHYVDSGRALEAMQVQGKPHVAELAPSFLKASRERDIMASRARAFKQAGQKLA